LRKCLFIPVWPKTLLSKKRSGIGRSFICDKDEIALVNAGRREMSWSTFNKTLHAYFTGQHIGSRNGQIYIKKHGLLSRIEEKIRVQINA
jgi:hypothetical protein